MKLNAFFSFEGRSNDPIEVNPGSQEKPAQQVLALMTVAGAGPVRKANEAQARPTPFSELQP